MQLIQLFILTLFQIFSLDYAYAETAPYIIYISPQGSDYANGQSPTMNSKGVNGPFATLNRARYDLRQRRKYAGLPNGAIVYVRKGTYELPETFILETQDSGTPKAPIIFQAYENEKVILSGGRQLSTCNTSKLERISCDTRPLSLNKLDRIGLDKRLLAAPLPPFEVFINNQRLQLTRWPNSDRSVPGGDTWAYISSAPKDTHTEFKYHGDTTDFSKLSENAVIHIWPASDWFDEYIGVSNTTPKQFILASPSTYAIQPGRRFSILNEPQTMDAPGEWSYSANQETLSIIPLPGFENSHPIISYLDNVINIRNADYIKFKGFVIEHSRKTAVKISGGSHNTIESCNIRNTGGYGIEIKKGINHSVIQSEIHDTGYGGIILNGGDRKTLTPSSHTAINNKIHHTGRLVRTGKAALRLDGVGNTASHNWIHHTPGTAVSLNGNNHLLELNDIHHACEESSDCGAVYTGRDWTFHGNKIQYNRIHDIYGYGMSRIDTEKNIVEYAIPHGARGIYLDDAASGFSITKNIFYKVPGIMIQIGGGRDNTIDNNIFITNSYAIWVDARWPNFPWKKTMEPRLNAVPYKGPIWRKHYPKLTQPMKNSHWPEGNRITHNIIIGETPAKNIIIPFRYIVSPDTTVINNNIVWNHNKKIKVEYRFLGSEAAILLADWHIWKKTGLDKDSLLAAPILNSTTQGGFSLRTNSYTEKLGISELSFNNTAKENSDFFDIKVATPIREKFQFNLQ